jgi:sphingomyelin phosphodiesterase acid-like 3
MAALAERFDRAFPKAQFVIALGNEDSGCTDYGFAPGSAFARGTAAVWAPLVNRNGAAPNFAATFARDGFYTARLPLEHTTAVVIDDVFWSPRYRSCGEGGGGARTMSELRAALREPGDRHWVVAHIPPGIDAYTTAHLAHSLAIVPFLDPDQRYEFVSLIDNPANRVSLVLAAHTHKFSYRILGKIPEAPLPVFLIPALSPIFGNAPSFLTVDVEPSGTIRSAEDHAYLDGAWTVAGGTQTLGLSEVTGANLLKLQERLENDETLRAVYARLYESGAKPEINDRNWRIYWCAATNFSTGDFRACSGAGGFGLITRRGERLAALAALLVLVAICVVAAIRLQR